MDTTTERYKRALGAHAALLPARERARVLAPVRAAHARYKANPSRATRGCYHVAIRFALGSARAAREGCFT